MKKPRVTVSFTDRELYLLDNGFSTSYEQDEADPDSVELAKISRKLQKAIQRITSK